jgi:hypothetical protein
MKSSYLIGTLFLSSLMMGCNDKADVEYAIQQCENVNGTYETSTLGRFFTCKYDGNKVSANISDYPELKSEYGETKRLPLDKTVKANSE